LNRINMKMIGTAMWIGGGFTQIIMIVQIHLTSSGEFLYAAHFFMHIFDLSLIIPSALGVVITGIVLSVRTHWGLTKYYWIISKEVIALVLIASGGVLNIWVQDAINISLTERLDALNNPAYLHDRLMLMLFGAGQLILLVTVVLTSVKKPWGKRKSQRLIEATNQ